jgi:hypothetical protein
VAIQPMRSGMFRTIAIPILGLTFACAAGSVLTLFATRALVGNSLPHAVVTVALFTVAVTMTCVAAGALDPSISRYLSSRESHRRADAAALWLGVRGFIVVSLAIILNSAPAFIYQAF